MVACHPVVGKLSGNKLSAKLPNFPQNLDQTLRKITKRTHVSRSFYSAYLPELAPHKFW
jgi:hypothetical protein